MIVEVTGVLRDASHPAGTVEQRVPFPQDIAVPRGETTVINLTVVKQDWTPADISVGPIVLGARAYRSDVAPAFERTAALVAPTLGTATITIPGSDTLPLSEQFAYLYDVQWTDGNGARWQLVPVSRLRVTGIVARPPTP